MSKVMASQPKQASDSAASNPSNSDAAPKVRLGDSLSPWSKTPKVRLGDSLMPW